MRVLTVVLDWGPVDTSCFESTDRCYAWSSTATDSMLRDDGWVGQNHYYTFVEADAIQVPHGLVAPVPEPSVVVSLVLGLGLIWFHRFGRAVQRPAWRTEQ